MTTVSLGAAILLLPWLISRVLSMLLSLHLTGVVASPQLLTCPHLFSCPQLLSTYQVMLGLRYCQCLFGGFLCL